jgi:hypothetical protein
LNISHRHKFDEEEYFTSYSAHTDVREDSKKAGIDYSLFVL